MKTINIRYQLTAPLSHIGETNSTESCIQTVLTAYGKLPVVTGNSIRGQLRNSGASHLLDFIGTVVDKEIFHILFSGGNLSGTMSNDIERSLALREQFPLISLLGSGVGSMILQGKINVGFVYPICQESVEITGIDSEISWKKLIGEIEFSRMDDEKNDKLTKYIDSDDINTEKKAKASTQMRFGVQYIAPGSELIQTIQLINTTDLEEGALYNAITKWFENPILGGMSAKGFGTFNAYVNNDITVVNRQVQISDYAKEKIDKYINFLEENKEKIDFSLLKAGKKNEKKDASTSKNNS